MGSNDHIPVPDPKPVTFAEITLTEGEGNKCGACGSLESVRRVDIRIGQYTSYGDRCLPCQSALGRCLMRVWFGDAPDMCDLNRLSSLRRQHRAEAAYAALSNVDRETETLAS